MSRIIRLTFPAFFLASAACVSHYVWGGDESQVARGRELFTRVWQPQKPSATQGDGLGPFFNERSCAACHKLGGVGGAGPNENNVQIINVAAVRLDPPRIVQEDIENRRAHGQELPTLTREQIFPHAQNGVMVLHRFSTVEGYERVRLLRLVKADPDHPEAAKVLPIDTLLRHRRATGGYGFCGVGRVTPPKTVEERNTPVLFGAGLIDSISLADLKAIAASQTDQVRGRPAVLPDGNVGRFGWKAQNATLADFCENACAVELGLETPRRRQTPRPFVRREPGRPSSEYVGPPVPDMTADEVLQLTAFVASLPAPTLRLVADEFYDETADGERLFTEVGCAECHRPNVGEARGIYSDLLLHRVGTNGSIYYETLPTPPGDLAAADASRPAAADEFRTPPLWGVAESAPYLHDGAAATLHDAIKAHGGQAFRAERQYANLADYDRQRLLFFLESLRAPATPLSKRS